MPVDDLAALVHQASVHARRTDLEWMSRILSRDGLVVVEPVSGDIVDADDNFRLIVRAADRSMLHGNVDLYLHPDKRGWHAAKRIEWIAAGRQPVLMDAREPLHILRHDGTVAVVGITLLRLGSLALNQVRDLEDGQHPPE